MAEKRWEGKVGNIPTAGIRVYTNVIPEEMSLREWLNGVGDPNPPIGETQPKSCKEFIDEIRRKVKYGDLEEEGCKFGPECCWYLGVSGIQDASVAGLKGVKFNDQYVSAGATHAVVTYKNKAGVILSFDIFVRLTGMSDENDRTIEAYNSFLGTFKIREE